MPRLLELLRRRYAEESPDEGDLHSRVPPIIWETGNVDQIRSLLVLREAELIVAKAQLTGNDRIDWYAKNGILDLEIKIANLRRWLAEAVKKKNRQ